MPRQLLEQVLDAVADLLIGQGPRGIGPAFRKHHVGDLAVRLAGARARILPAQRLRQGNRHFPNFASEGPTSAR